jgi:hypothetical protein
LLLLFFHYINLEMLKADVFSLFGKCYCIGIKVQTIYTSEENL